MFIVPFVCNILQIWVIDNILKFIPSSKEEIKLLEYSEINELGIYENEEEFNYNNKKNTDNNNSKDQINEI
jgi:hypothetical protein